MHAAATDLCSSLPTHTDNGPNAIAFSDKLAASAAEAMRELADHYMKKGQRSPVPRNVVDSVRKHLLTAREALPEVEEKGGFLGMGF